jgi:hypothetical protein
MLRLLFGSAGALIRTVAAAAFSCCHIAKLLRTKKAASALPIQAPTVPYYRFVGDNSEQSNKRAQRSPHCAFANVCKFMCTSLVDDADIYHSFGDGTPKGVIISIQIIGPVYAFITERFLCCF